MSQPLKVHQPPERMEKKMRRGGMAEEEKLRRRKMEGHLTHLNGGTTLGRMSFRASTK